MTTQPARSATRITASVWRALFLRESLSRLFGTRSAWFWLLFEPLFHVAYLMVIFKVVRVRTIGGIDVAVWIMVGLLAFFMFRRTGIQVMNAIGANKALFSYRQVKPADTVLVRGGLEGFLVTVITLLILAGSGLFGLNVIPADPLAVFEAFLGLWLVGMGFGLVSSVVVQLLPEIGRTFNLAMMPLYLLSGVMFPISVVPQPYRDWMLFNPVAHGLEAARLGFAPYYHAVPGLSLGYLYGFALVSVFLGLALQVRFARRLATR